MVGIIQNSVHLVCEVGGHSLAGAVPVFIHVACVLIHDGITGAAEVGAGLAVYIVHADGESLRLQHIGIAVVEAYIVAVRSFVIEREFPKVLDEFALETEHGSELHGAGKSVSLGDVAHRTTSLHAVGVEFPLIRHFVNVGSVSHRHVFFIAKAHDYICAHGVEGFTAGIVVAILTTGKAVQFGRAGIDFSFNGAGKFRIDRGDAGNNIAYIGIQFGEVLAIGD